MRRKKNKDETDYVKKRKLHFKLKHRQQQNNAI